MDEFLTAATDMQSPLLDILCDALPAGLLVYDRNDLITFASRQILNFFSLPTDVMLPGTRLRDFLGAVFDTRPRSAEPGRGAVSREDWIAERLASHWRERSDLVENHSYGRWVRFVKRRFPNGSGICIMTDVSEHHKREEQWRSDLARVQLTEEILDNLPFPVFVKDQGLAYVAINRAFCHLRGLEAVEILGRTVFDFAPRPVAEVFDAADRQVLETGDMVTVPERLVSPDGGEISVITRKLRIGKPGRHYLLTTMEDITELSAGLAADEGAENWPATKFDPAQFPNVERGDPYLSTLLAEARVKPIETILPERFHGRRVLLVSSDVTVAAQAERVFNRLSVEFCCVTSALEQEAFLRTAGECGVDIDVLVIDSQMESRSIELAEHHGINVLVMDGYHMAGELSYQLVRHFNSPWGRQRQQDRNPLADWDIETIVAEPHLALSMVDVLVVEDNPVNQIVFSQILEGLGHSWRIAETGEEALKLAPDLMPRLVLIDQTLPGLSGLELARRLGESDCGLADIPLIGVIVAGQEPDRAACLAAGMCDTLMKPVSPETLETLLRSHLCADARAVAAA